MQRFLTHASIRSKLILSFSVLILLIGFAGGTGWMLISRTRQNLEVLITGISRINNLSNDLYNQLILSRLSTLDLLNGSSTERLVQSAGLNALASSAAKWMRNALQPEFWRIEDSLAKSRESRQNAWDDALN